MEIARLGVASLIRGELPSAIAHLRAAASQGSSAVEHDLALALRTSGDLSGALLHAERAVALAPRAPSLALLASLLILSDRRSEGIERFEDALAIDPNHAPSLYALGLLLGEAPRVRAALPGLSPLLAARARDQLASLEAGGRLPSDLCSFPLFSEVLAVDVGPSRLAPRQGVAQSSANLAPSRPQSLQISDVAGLLARAQCPLALTGAGISSASGLRTRKELWQSFDRDQAVSIARFLQDPLQLWGVVREFLGSLDPKPNAAHRALAALPLAALLTQNVDGLHQAADPSSSVVELHGSLLATRCDACGARGPSCRELLNGVLPPPCSCGGSLRPDVVLFGEWVPPERLKEALTRVQACDLLLVVGTALDVAPAALLVDQARRRGVPVVEFKRTPSRLHERLGTLHLPGPAERTLPQVLDAWRKLRG